MDWKEWLETDSIDKSTKRNDEKKSKIESEAKERRISRISKDISNVIKEEFLTPTDYIIDDPDDDKAKKSIMYERKRIDIRMDEIIKQLRENAIPVLIDLYKNYGKNERKFAEKALWRIREYLAIEPLIQALSDENWHIRRIIVGQLGAIGDAKAIEALVKASKDDIKEVREAAIDTLKQIERSNPIPGMQIVIGIMIEEAKRENSDGVSIKRIKNIAKERNIEEIYVDKIIEYLYENNEIYTPKSGYIRLA